MKKKLMAVIILSAVGLPFVITSPVGKSFVKKQRSYFAQLGFLLLGPSVTERKAIANFQRELATPKKWEVHENKGWSFQQQGKYQPAIEEYKKAIELSQNEPGAKELYKENDWGNLHELSKEELDKANEKIIADSQKFTRHRLAESYEKSGHYQEAFEQIDWLLAHDPLPHVWYELTLKKEELLSNIQNIPLRENEFAQSFKHHMALQDKLTKEKKYKEAQGEYIKAIQAMVQDPVVKQKFGNQVYRQYRL